MKKMLMTSKMLLLIGALTFVLTSCSKKSSVTSEDAEVAAAQNLNVAEVEDDNTQIMADEAQDNGTVAMRGSTGTTSASGLITPCAVVTRDTTSATRTITIDFGTGCTGAHGTRKGKIIITYTGRYRDEGTVIHIVSQDYYVNDNKIDIDRTVTNQGTNGSGNYVFLIHATRVVTFPGGETSSSTVDKTREWVEGASTPHDFSDDVYRVTGTGTHTSRAGIVYDATTLTALTRKVECQEFVSGDVQIVRHGTHDKTAVIDFGNGTCDDEATVTLDNGKTFTIDLRH